MGMICNRYDKEKHYGKTTVLVCGGFGEESKKGFELKTIVDTRKEINDKGHVHKKRNTLNP